MTVRRAACRNDIPERKQAISESLIAVCLSAVLYVLRNDQLLMDVS